MARKSGVTWNIGGINGTEEKLSCEIDLSRLNEKRVFSFNHYQ